MSHEQGVPPALHLTPRMLLEVILDIWREHFGNEVSASSSLYGSGGSSLTAAKIAAAIGTRLGSRVRVRTILQHFTPSALSEALWLDLVHGGAAFQGSALPLMEAMNDGAVAPASVQQEAIWFMEEMQPDNFAYNTIVVLRFKGLLDADMLKRACAALVSRHSILRTPFGVRDGSLVQLEEGDAPLPFAEEDLRDASDEAVALMIRELGQVSFNVGQPPLLSWTLIRKDEREWLLVQVEHHFIHDGWSSWILMRDLSALYRGIILCEAPAAHGYRAFARAQRKYIQGPEAEAERGWWAQQLEGCCDPGENSASAQLRPPFFNHLGGTVDLPLSKPVCRSVKRLSAKLEATPFTVLMAAFISLIGHITHGRNFAIGSMLRNRPRSELLDVVGMFVTTIAVPVRDMPQHSMRTLVASLKSVLSESDEHADLPFPLVVERLNLPRDPSRNPVFDICFSYNDWPDTTLDFGSDMSVAVKFPSNGGAKFDLDVVLFREPSGYRLLWRYYEPIYSPETVRSLAHRFENTVLELERDTERAFQTLWDLAGSP